MEILSGTNVVYLVDRDAAIGEALTSLLETYDIDVQSYRSAETFLDLCPLPETGQSCLLVETSLPGLSGSSLLRVLQSRAINLPTLIMTDNASNNIRRQARALNVIDVIEKPLVSESLIPHLSALFPSSHFKS